MARNTRKWKRLAGEVGATLVEQLVGAIHESAHRVREQEEQAELDGDAADEVEDDAVDSAPRAQHWGGVRWKPPPGFPGFSGRGSKQSTNRTQGSGRRESPRPPPADSAPPKKTPYEVLGMTSGMPLKAYEKVYQVLSFEEGHPDKGGSAERQAELNAAIAEIRKALKKN